jgi:hypothetical protein
MGLRQSIDEGAGEIGADIGEELPESAEELRTALPDDASALSTNGSDLNDGTLTVDRVVSGTPLDRFL